MTPFWLFLASFMGASSWVAPSPLLPLASPWSTLPTPPFNHESCEKLEQAEEVGGASKASSPSISFPWLGKCLRERALSVPGRRWHVQSKLALSQHLALVNAFSQLRNWAKFGQRPIQSPVLEYVSIPPLHLLSPESPEGQTSCSHTGLSSVWLDITFPLQEKN